MSDARDDLEVHKRRSGCCGKSVRYVDLIFSYFQEHYSNSSCWKAHLGLDHKHGGADKISNLHDFYAAYEDMFARFGDTANLLEIGVNAGNSLAVWSAWFSGGSVVGIDVDLQLFYESWPSLLALGANRSGNVQAIQGDAYASGVVNRLVKKTGKQRQSFQIVIDDAVHTANSSLILFEALFPTLLADGGLYVIEDAWEIRELTTYFKVLLETNVALPNVGVGEDDGKRAKDRRCLSQSDWRDTIAEIRFQRNLIIIERQRCAVSRQPQ